MTDLVFTPTFHHTPWIDNQDRVQAAGQNGFNVRFTAIETDLQSVSDVVGDIGTALAALGTAPPPTLHTMSVSPALIPISGASSWAHDASGYAVRTGALTTLAGLMPIQVPDGAALVSLRVVGQNNGAGSLQISLNRAQLAGVPIPSERLARVTGDSSPFDGTSSVDTGVATVDNTTYRYFLTATLDGATTADVVGLSGFQIAYKAP